MTRTRHVLLVAAALLGACTTLGWRFGPGLPCTSGDLFAAPPVVVHRGEAYVLAWTQGAYPFFFRPDYRARDGRLVFALPATSSSGYLAGRPQEMQVEGDENLEALRRGGAVWWERGPEPGGRFVELAIVEAGPSLPGPTRDERRSTTR